ncbi:MAG: hypothetical protein PUB22_00020 [Clostridiales bacterium]|nr:hypothetical protein [Clostridiales bacterium]
MENKIKHLEMIQGVITRMASNSFALKGWAVTLVAGIFALAGKDVDKIYFLVAYIPIIVFWGLDSYYLMQERLYRSLYETVRKQKLEEIDFSMNANLPEFNTKKNEYGNCFFSKTELWFYLPLAIVTAGIIIITHI